ncbi:MAG: DUF4827 family protein [Porphyromonas sp.]|nr:DUF4827 family protein [Porphyromonas sp.]
MKNISIALLSLLMVFSFTGCRKNTRLSYVEMLKREESEIRTFMDKEGIVILPEVPEGKVMEPNQFAKIKEGLYINIKDLGNGNKPTSGKTVIQARFTVESLADQSRFEVENPLFTNYEGAVGGTRPLNFIYHKDGIAMHIDPTTPSDNNQIQVQFGCEALLRALEYVSEGGEVRIITSFRTGPSMMTKEGIPLYYSVVRYEFKH